MSPGFTPRPSDTGRFAGEAGWLLASDNRVPGPRGRGLTNDADVIGEIRWVWSSLPWNHESRTTPWPSTVAKAVSSADIVRTASPMTRPGWARSRSRTPIAGTERSVEGVLMAPVERLELAGALKRRVEGTALQIPKSTAIRRDLHAVRRATGPHWRAAPGGH